MSSKVTSSEELLTSTQAGQILGKSGRTVVRMIEAGDLPVAGKLPGPNGAFLIRRSDVIEYAERHDLGVAQVGRRSSALSA